MRFKLHSVSRSTTCMFCSSKEAVKISFFGLADSALSLFVWLTMVELRIIGSSSGDGSITVNRKFADGACDCSYAPVKSSEELPSDSSFMLKRACGKRYKPFRSMLSASDFPSSSILVRNTLKCLSTWSFSSPRFDLLSSEASIVRLECAIDYSLCMTVEVVISEIRELSD